jgi:enamine deaminase RidA (YjgF/YER057c/UK114 family)
MGTREHLNLPGRRTDLPFSDAVRIGDTLYISGRIGFEPGTMKLPASPDQEARNLLDGIQSVLQIAKMEMDDLVYVQLFCSDVSLFDTFNSVYRGYFKKDLPARAFLGSGPLLFNARFEMMGIAVKR